MSTYPHTPTGAGSGSMRRRPPSSVHSLAASSSRPPSYRESVAKVHAAVYNSTAKGKERETIATLLEECYDSEAVFENPVVNVAGRQHILEQLSLTALLPGSIYSEIQDVCESQSFAGNHRVLLTHTVHLRLHLNPFSSPAPPPATYDGQTHSAYYTNSELQTRAASWNSFYYGNGTGWDSATEGGWTSYATTPAGLYSSLPPTNTDGDDGQATPTHSTLLQQQQHQASLNQPRQREYPSNVSSNSLLSFRRISSLAPWNIYHQFTNIAIKILTRLEFNEADKVVRHEDIYDVKAVLEGLPFFGTIYNVNRTLLGWTASKASNLLLGSSSKPRRSSEIEGKKTTTFSSPLCLTQGAYDEEQNSPKARSSAESGQVDSTDILTQDDASSAPSSVLRMRPLRNNAAGLQLEPSTLLRRSQDHTPRQDSPVSSSTPATSSADTHHARRESITSNIVGGVPRPGSPSPFRLKAQPARPIVSSDIFVGDNANEKAGNQLSPNMDQ